MRHLIPFWFVIALFAAAHAHAEPPELALAGVYEKGVALDDYWVSEKLDGVRAYWDGERFWSRGGNEYRAPDWFTEGFPDVPMDGELWMGRGRFAELSGAVRRLEPVDPSWRQIFRRSISPLLNVLRLWKRWCSHHRRHSWPWSCNVRPRIMSV